MNPEQNPYQVPQADVINAAGDRVFHEARALPSGHGSRWLGEAWALFKSDPLMWVAIVFLYVISLSVINMVPLLGSLFAPVFMAGIYRTAQIADETGKVRAEELFSGFREGLGSLLLVGLLTLVAVVGIAVVCGVVAFLAFGLSVLQPEPDGGTILGILAFSLVVAALILPVIMAGWFAPALVAFQGMSAIEALKSSFTACMRNIMPMTIYGLIGVVMLVVAVIPVGLGLLVAFPVLMISCYTAYKDIFLAND